MRLLVSVRSPVEVAAALAGGAEIIDAKEPLRGSLGPVDPEVLAAIAAAVPEEIPLSAALGDPIGAVAAREAVRAVGPLLAARREAYVKIGLACAGGARQAADLLEAAALAANPAPTLVAVAYADWTRAGTPDPGTVTRLAVDAGARGVLIDTFGKDGGDLFRHLDRRALAAWVEQARSAGLLVALAGSLSEDSILPLGGLNPDVLGFRGAACDGGRTGSVSAPRVRRLGVAMARAAGLSLSR